MEVSYKKLWKLIIDKDMTNVEVRRAAKISPATKGSISTMAFLII